MESKLSCGAPVSREDPKRKGRPLTRPWQIGSCREVVARGHCTIGKLKWVIHRLSPTSAAWARERVVEQSQKQKFIHEQHSDDHPSATTRDPMDPSLSWRRQTSISALTLRVKLFVSESAGSTRVCARQRSVSIQETLHPTRSSDLLHKRFMSTWRTNGPKTLESTELSNWPPHDRKQQGASSRSSVTCSQCASEHCYKIIVTIPSLPEYETTSARETNEGDRRRKRQPQRPQCRRPHPAARKSGQSGVVTQRRPWRINPCRCRPPAPRTAQPKRLQHTTKRSVSGRRNTQGRKRNRHAVHTRRQRRGTWAQESTLLRRRGWTHVRVPRCARAPCDQTLEGHVHREEHTRRESRSPASCSERHAGLSTSCILMHRESNEIPCVGVNSCVT